jgi:predicted transcriptional regulator
MTSSDRFHDLLFEMSNENRYKILQVLQNESKRIMDLTKQMKLTTTEVRRHVIRLSEAGLIHRNINGYYQLTPYGEASLLLFQEFQFLSSNQEYFKTHTPLKIPIQFVKQLGKLNKTTYISNPMDFIRHTQNLLKESENQVSILVDEFPMTLLPNIVEAIDRGVTIRTIESKDQVIEPDFSKLTSDESRAIDRTRTTPLYERRILDDINLQFFLSESNCVLSFPLKDHQYDYTGFLCSEEKSLEWCNELYSHYWGQATARISEKPREIKRGYGRTIKEKGILEGVNDPRIDAQAVQDAVDNYKEVILKGKFNFGDSEVIITKSVIIRGEGRENEVPKTILYKTGWTFPIRRFASIFKLCEDGIDVSIENLHFSDFNCGTMSTGLRFGEVAKPNSIKVLNNRVTLPQGYGRAFTYAAFGDMIHGIQAAEMGAGGVLIEGNYIDFAVALHARGVLSRGGLKDDPEYRPDLINHEYFASIGIGLYDCTGNIIVQNNIIKNVSGRGIVSLGHSDSSEVFIRDNVIESEVYGSYPFSSRDSATGILAQVGYGQKNMPGYHVSIERNKIKLEKVNQSGITILGPSDEGSLKFRSGVIQDNTIQLGDGYEGIHIRKCDDFDISGNKISGNAYYGLRISGTRKFGGHDMGSFNNLVEKNDLQDLVIKTSDDYVLNHSDGKMFSKTYPRTGHVWLDRFSKKNKISLSKNKILIDEGENNEIIKLTY